PECLPAAGRKRPHSGLKASACLHLRRLSCIHRALYRARHFCEPRMPPPGPAPRTRRDGCGFTIGTCVFTCLLLVLNGLIVTAVYQWAFPTGPTSLMQRLKAAQVFMFVGPVLLL